MNALQLSAYGVEELDARTAAETDGGIWPWIVPAAIATYIAKDIYDNAGKFVEGFKEGYAAVT
ncbi:MAG TPA: hypothetical protein VF263_20505 [Longimicrobiaceae bacterium]